MPLHSSNEFPSLLLGLIEKNNIEGILSRLKSILQLDESILDILAGRSRKNSRLFVLFNFIRIARMNVLLHLFRHACFEYFLQSNFNLTGPKLRQKIREYSSLNCSYRTLSHSWCPELVEQILDYYLSAQIDRTFIDGTSPDFGMNTTITNTIVFRLAKANSNGLVC